MIKKRNIDTYECKRSVLGVVVVVRDVKDKKRIDRKIPERDAALCEASEQQEWRLVRKWLLL